VLTKILPFWLKDWTLWSYNFL